MSIAALNIGSSYTFNTLSPSILGAVFTNVKLIGVMDYNSAMKIRNVNVPYRAIYPTLPLGTVNDPTANLYYQFETLSGTTELLAEQWIDVPTIVQVTTVNFRVTLNDVSLQDMNTVRDVLYGMGYTNFTVEQI